MKSDGDLLRDFAEKRDEGSFAQIVDRHIGFVYAVSLRRLRDSHAAKDATQGVFIALARKARSVAGAPSVIGWLHRSACYETQNIMRSQTNRRVREIEAHRLGTILPEARPDLEAIKTVLDDVLCELSDADREAVLARFFSKQSYAAIGASLRLTENAARMRVERALAKLRERLEHRGVTSTAVALAAALPSYALETVPSGLATVVTKGAVLSLAGGTGVAATFLAFMSTSKLITGAAVIAVLGGLLYQHHHTSQLQNDLAAARAETTAAIRQVEAVRHELAVLRNQRQAETDAAASASAGRSGNSAPATVSANPAP
ncbi:MAG TPA: sigma-70 family RNA polymerase sigma factor [Opitutaceae bacterium]